MRFIKGREKSNILQRWGHWTSAAAHEDLHLTQEGHGIGRGQPAETKWFFLLLSPAVQVQDVGFEGWRAALGLGRRRWNLDLFRLKQWQLLLFHFFFQARGKEAFAALKKVGEVLEKAQGRDLKVYNEEILVHNRASKVKQDDPGLGNDN